jgi:hypothetical protein
MLFRTIALSLALLFLVAGCTVQLTGAPTVSAPSAATSAASVVPAATAAALATTPAQPLASPTPAAPATATEGAASSAASGTAAAGSAATGGTPSAPAGWQTYVNQTWQVAIDYPGDWTVHQAGPAFYFSGPGAGTVQLSQVPAGGVAPQQYLQQEPLPNERCRLGQNPHNVQTRVCLDTIARTWTADLVITGPDGKNRLFTLSMSFPRGAGQQTFDQMVASARPAGQ